MKNWIKILIILAMIVAGIGIYFLLTGDAFQGAKIGNSMPQPPMLPD